MGFTKPYLPDVDPDTFLKKPLMERMRILAIDWAENGFGSPRMIHTIYIVKLVVFFAIGGITVATATSGLPAFWHVTEWWNQPIVYQKVILWTVLLEAIGVAGSWGPLAGKVKPMTGGILFWARPGTIRLRPWKWVPFTNGDRRTWFDIGVYLALLVSLAVALLSPGVHSDSLSKALPHNISGLVNPALLVAPIALLVLIGLRDKTIFLAARGEQYLPVLFFFAVLPFVNMIIALKMLIVVVWVGAGFSKFGKHFSNVIPPMVSNTIIRAQMGATGPLPRLRARHAAVAAGGLHGTRQRHHGRDRGPAGPVLLHQQVGDAGRGAVHGGLPPVHHLDVPAGGAAGMERGLRLHHDLPVPRLPELERIRPVEHVAALAGPRHRRRAAVLPDPGQPATRQGVLPAFDAAVRGQLGLGGVDVRARCRAEAEPGHPLGVQPDRPVRRCRLRAASGRRSPCRRRSRGAACTARVAACSRCC